MRDLILLLSCLQLGLPQPAATAPPKVTHVVSGNLALVQKTLGAQAWQVEGQQCLHDDACLAQLPADVALTMVRPGEHPAKAYFWETGSYVSHLPLLHACACAVPAMPGTATLTFTCEDAEDGLTQDLLEGIAMQRHDRYVSGEGVPWIELRHAAHEIDGYISTTQSPLWCAADLEVGSDASLAVSLPWMPPVVPLGDALADTVLWRDNEDDKQVALTFDACSTFYHGQYNRAVIDVLVKYEIPATLFIGGHWAETHPEELQFLAAHPQFELGNHTYSHPHMTHLSPQRQREELLWTQYLIYTLTGRMPRFWRPPYGETDDALTSVSAQLGLYTVEFDLPAGDATLDISPARLRDWVLRKASSGSIVVMHMNHPTSKTALVLPEVATTLRARGYTLARVSDLLARMRARFVQPGS